ncbi:MAG: hypothetical protein KJ927_14980 [Candidatus Eisenbacteria bacterium]|nr:hypothetical protein [Candidatus Eisenbacteria bacterium]
MLKKILLLGLAVALCLPLGAGASGDFWIHVYVNEAGSDGDRVKINLPLNLVESILPMIETDELHDGILELDELDLAGIEFDKLGEILRKSEDGEYVTIEEDDEIVRISKEGDRILIHVESRKHKKSGDGPREKVEINLPIHVIDALTTDDPHELNIIAAIEALTKEGETGLITVHDDDDIVRVWIDKKSTQDD